MAVPKGTCFLLLFIFCLNRDNGVVLANNQLCTSLCKFQFGTLTTNISATEHVYWSGCGPLQLQGSCKESNVCVHSDDGKFVSFGSKCSSGGANDIMYTEGDDNRNTVLELHCNHSLASAALVVVANSKTLFLRVESPSFCKFETQPKFHDLVLKLSNSSNATDTKTSVGSTSSSSSSTASSSSSSSLLSIIYIFTVSTVKDSSSLPSPTINSIVSTVSISSSFPSPAVNSTVSIMNSSSSFPSPTTSNTEPIITSTVHLKSSAVSSTVNPVVPVSSTTVHPAVNSTANPVVPVSSTTVHLAVNSTTAVSVSNTVSPVVPVASTTVPSAANVSNTVPSVVPIVSTYSHSMSRTVRSTPTVNSTSTVSSTSPPTPQQFGCGPELAIAVVVSIAGTAALTIFATIIVCFCLRQKKRGSTYVRLAPTVYFDDDND